MNQGDFKIYISPFLRGTWANVEHKNGKKMEQIVPTTSRSMIEVPFSTKNKGRRPITREFLPTYTCRIGTRPIERFPAGKITPILEIVSGCPT